ncbi:MAG: glycosyltransferase, partial [Methyloversatilis sp.]|nr:glycosyltransferase [Methyloversatilis sp.]
FVHRYLTVSRDLQNWLVDAIGVDASRVTQIYNGVDKQRFCPSTVRSRDLLPEGFRQDCFVIGSVGRMVGVKDYPTLVSAFIRACAQSGGDALRLVIIGDGVARGPCQKLVDEAGVAAQVWFPGERSDIPALMKSFDVFVLPSLGEGISNTILEAMACGLPIVSTRVGGTPELVDDAVNGRLFAPGDVATLSSIIVDYAAAPALLAAHGSASRQRIESSFSIEAMVAAYRNTYLTLSGTQGRPDASTT